MATLSTIPLLETVVSFVASHFLPVVLVALGLGAFTAAIAVRRGRNSFFWWLFGTALFVLALPLILILPDKNVKICPECAESVRKDASKCRFCGYLFAPHRRTVMQSEQGKREDWTL